VCNRCPACGSPTEGRVALSAPDRHYAVFGDSGVTICSHCGSGATVPHHGSDDLARLYPTEYQAYEEPHGTFTRMISAGIRGLQAARAWRTGVLAALRELPTGRLLDVGCGRGDLLVLLGQRGWRAEGLEPSLTAARRARAKGLVVDQGTLSSVDLVEGAYDAVLFHHSLEHTDDPERDLLLVRRALRPGGRLIVVVPNFGGWQARAFKSHWYHLDLPRHRTHFTPRGLARLLERTGFTVEETRLRTTSVGLPASVQYRLFGRCLFPNGTALRVATGLCLALGPLVAVLDGIIGQGDAIHTRAVRL
jgi:SAM-dependent methyltransferase